MGQNTTERNGSADQGVELLVTTDSELQMAGRDTLDFEILSGVSSKFEDFGGEVLENGGEIDGGFAADARLLAGDVPEMAFYAAAGELEEGDGVSASVSM